MSREIYQQQAAQPAITTLLTLLLKLQCWLSLTPSSCWSLKCSDIRTLSCPQLANAPQELSEALASVHSAVSAVSTEAADVLHIPLSQLSALVARTQSENSVLGQAFRVLKARMSTAGLSCCRALRACPLTSLSVPGELAVLAFLALLLQQH